MVGAWCDPSTLPLLHPCPHPHPPSPTTTWRLRASTPVLSSSPSLSTSSTRSGRPSKSTSTFRASPRSLVGFLRRLKQTHSIRSPDSKILSMRPPSYNYRSLKPPGHKIWCASRPLHLTRTGTHGAAALSKGFWTPQTSAHFGQNCLRSVFHDWTRT